MPSIVKTITEKNYRTEASGKKVLLDNIEAGCQATCTMPRWDLLKKDPHEPLSLDIEFQEAKLKDAQKWTHRMGRVAIVNTRGEAILDVYVRYPYDRDTAVKMPPKRFNVSWKDLQIRNGAKTSEEVEDHLREIMKERVIVGSGMRLDLIAVGDNVWQKDHEIFDCQDHYGQVALATLASRYLPAGDFNWHDPADDARIAMLLYLRLHKYDGRDSFKDAPYQHKAEEFPSLAAAATMKKK